jgi:hypothetical protein
MNDSKPAIASVSVWGVILVGLSTALKLAGVDVPGLDDPDLALNISTLIGAALALWGRMRPHIVPIAGLIKSK